MDTTEYIFLLLEGNPISLVFQNIDPPSSYPPGKCVPTAFVAGGGLPSYSKICTLWWTPYTSFYLYSFSSWTPFTLSSCASSKILQPMLPFLIYLYILIGVEFIHRHFSPLAKDEFYSLTPFPCPSICTTAVKCKQMYTLLI